ncbi:DNA-binding transcriptional LysR family regulator [Leucobacter exalbidus]|uniref:DNA-binding transcriptional LysR family regulator n=1 Tax=Leucobacter exalbidus TaxID=662960 RepID=A0A940PKM7_9MICO|nr:LysR family transcriptional regulator [Leucobacter exalbidus]MBP1325672.1 DNA-binding transcriptional LysR family regulator [Leucobacter exalbidus]
MEVHHLRTLRELRDRGSVTAVAAALHLSPSAVSQQLAALQRGVPVPLTEQQGRVLVLTPAGERVADAGGKVLESLAQVENVVHEYLTAPHETVTVTAFHSAGLAWFPDFIATCMADRKGPTVRCRDEDVSITEFVDLVSEHDVVIAHRPLASEPWPTHRVHVTEVLTEPIDIALHRDHPLAAQQTVRLADLAEESWVAAHEGFALEPLLVQAVSASAGFPINIAHRVNEFNMVAAIIAKTKAVGMLPRYTGLIPYFRDEVVLRPLEGLTVGRHIDILTRPETQARASTRTVIDRFVRIAQETQRRAEA